MEAVTKLSLKDKLEKKRMSRGERQKLRLARKEERAAKDAKAGGMSVSDRVARLETFFSRVAQNLSQDIRDLRANDEEIAEAIDVNARAFSKICEKMGVTQEEQARFVKEARDDIAREIEARRVAHEAALKKTAQAQEKQAVTDAVEKSEAGVPPPPPEEAVVFGG